MRNIEKMSEDIKQLVDILLQSLKTQCIVKKPKNHKQIAAIAQQLTAILGNVSKLSSGRVVEKHSSSEDIKIINDFLKKHSNY